MWVHKIAAMAGYAGLVAAAPRLGCHQFAANPSLSWVRFKIQTRNHAPLLQVKFGEWNIFMQWVRLECRFQVLLRHTSIIEFLRGEELVKALSAKTLGVPSSKLKFWLFVFPTSRYCLNSLGFLVSLVSMLHNNLVESFHYLWRSVAEIQDKDVWYVFFFNFFLNASFLFLCIEYISL